jgi:hypothetical protein
VSVKAATVLGQPFPKCGTFHRFVPMYQVLNCVEPGSASLETWPLCEILRRFVDLRQTTNDRSWPKTVKRTSQFDSAMSAVDAQQTWWLQKTIIASIAGVHGPKPSLFC